MMIRVFFTPYLKGSYHKKNSIALSPYCTELAGCRLQVASSTYCGLPRAPIASCLELRAGCLELLLRVARALIAGCIELREGCL